MASRMAARSTMQGTPVKSCMMTRADAAAETMLAVVEHGVLSGRDGACRPAQGHAPIHPRWAQRAVQIILPITRLDGALDRQFGVARIEPVQLLHVEGIGQQQGMV